MPPPRTSLALAASLLSLALCGCADSDSRLPEADEAVTFNEHLAPIIFEHCSYCHRPGEAGPFDLLTYDNARERAEQNIEAAESGFMPPWQPERGVLEFVGELGMTEEQIGFFRRWFDGGMLEGDPRHRPPTPQWIVGWPRGEPDLVIEPEETYTLRAEGIDVYQTLVVPIPTDRSRYVRAIDLRPGNPQAVHHAVMRIDRSQSTRMMDAEHEEEPGYPGMAWGEALPPEGRFLGWTPGRMIYEEKGSSSWTLKPGSHLALQLHMVPVGKPEPIRPKIGLYFTDEPPRHARETVLLLIKHINVPPGERVTMEESYELPVPVTLISVYPHAHYIGKQMQAWAILPDGSKKWLLRIENWDFSWQDQYHYAEPVSLPAGTTLAARFTYDNSADNPSNPFHPPQRIVRGVRSTNEMGSMSFEVILDDPKDRDVLNEAMHRQDLVNWPNYWVANGELGTILLNRGDYAEAVKHLVRAVKEKPSYAGGYNNLGAALSHLGNQREAMISLRRALEIRPQFADAHYNLGVELAALGHMEKAIDHYRQALAVRSLDAAVHNNLGVALASRMKFGEATDHFRRALEIDPDYADALGNLGNMFLSNGDHEAAIRNYTRALELLPGSEDLQVNLAEANRLKEVHEQRERTID